MTTAPAAGPAARLGQLREQARRRVADARRVLADLIDSASSTTGDDEHDPDGATIGFERAQAQASLDAGTARLAGIDAALQRLERGDYGVCVSCGASIGAARLDARPAAEHCLDCAGGRHRTDTGRRSDSLPCPTQGP